jgi:hypothetical protein
VNIFKNKPFDEWANKLKITNSILVSLVDDLEKGLYEANLGGHVYKKRVSVGNRGKSGGARTIIAFKTHNKAFFIYGFSKNEKANITKKETEALKGLAKLYLSYDDKQIHHAIKHGELIEVKHEKIDS